MAYDPNAWHDFYVMVGGAAAALTGLVFVALSIHRRAIVANQFLLVRSRYLTGALTAIPLTAAMVLVPGQPDWVLGAELVAAVLGFWFLFYLPLAHIRSEIDGGLVLRLALGVTSSLLWLGAGISLIADAGGGLYLLFPGVLIALAVNVAGAWSVLLGTDSDAA